MPTLDIESQTDQGPLASGGFQTTQGKLAKAQDFFDDPDNWLDSRFAEAIDRLTHLGLKLISHFDFWRGIVGRWGRCLSKKGTPTTVMGFPSGGEVGFN